MKVPYFKCTLEIAKKSKLRESHVHLERQPALSALTALPLCFSNWFKEDLMSGIKKNLAEVSAQSTEKSLSDVYKKKKKYLSHGRKVSVNFTLESLVWSCTKGNVLRLLT